MVQVVVCQVEQVQGVECQRDLLSSPDAGKMLPKREV